MNKSPTNVGHHLYKFDVEQGRYVGVNQEVFDWLADDLHGHIDPASKSELDDFLRPIYLEKRKLACGCNEGDQRVVYAVRKSNKSFRTQLLTPANEHRIGCRLRPKTSSITEPEKKALQIFFSQFCLSHINETEGLGINSGVDQRWINKQAGSVWAVEELPRTNIGFCDPALQNMLNKLRNGEIAQALIIGRYSGTKRDFKLKLIGSAGEFHPQICGPVLDLRRTATISGRHYGLCVLQQSDDEQIIATQAAAFTLMTSGWPIPVRDLEIRWAIFTLASKLEYVKSRYPNAEIRADLRYDNGFADPTSILLYLPSHPSPRVIAIRKRGGEICVPESLQPYLTGSQFVIQDPERRFPLVPQHLTPAHKSFKKSIYAELQNGVV